jgi:hypothetical protein
MLPIIKIVHTGANRNDVGDDEILFSFNRSSRLIVDIFVE